ncbi:MAG: hypothetical protein K9G81_20010 [Rhodobacteraceae bacterium]|nr:hypothetical protein [Paracoccaceae bacterium]
MTPISLAHLTVPDMAPPQMIHLAADLGYDRVGLRLIRVTDTTPGYALHEDPAALRDTRAALDATGITVNDIKFSRLTPEFRAGSLLPFLNAGAELAALPPERRPFLHLCDAPVKPSYSTENLLHAGHAEWFRPGERHIDLKSILACLPRNLPISLEVPMTALSAQSGSRLVAQRVLHAAQDLLRPRFGQRVEQ